MSAALPERYGSPSRGARRAVVIGSGLLGVVALAWLAWVTFVHATPQASSALVSWSTVDDHEVAVRIDVRLADGVDPSQATCTVRAVAEDHTVVGEARFTPVDGVNQVSVRTERRATSAESLGCTTPDQSRPR